MIRFHQSHKKESEAVVRMCSVKKALLEILQNSQENTYARVSFLKKRLWYMCFAVNFAKFLRTSFLTGNLQWLLLAFQSESTLYSFRTFCSKVLVNSNLMEIQPFKHSSNKFSLLYCTLLDFFNENMLRQRGLDKSFWERFLLVSKY